MKHLHYINTQLLTVDDVARALMAYARTLALVGSSDVVQIPVVDEAGNESGAELLIGPTSELLCLDAMVEDVLLARSTAAVADLQRRNRSRLPPLRDVIEAMDALRESEQAAG